MRIPRFIDWPREVFLIGAGEIAREVFFEASSKKTFPQQERPRGLVPGKPHLYLVREEDKP